MISQAIFCLLINQLINWSFIPTFLSAIDFKGAECELMLSEILYRNDSGGVCVQSSTDRRVYIMRLSCDVTPQLKMMWQDPLTMPLFSHSKCLNAFNQLFIDPSFLSSSADPNSYWKGGG